MEHEEMLSLIARQIDEARLRGALLKRMGEDCGQAQSILEALRFTYWARSVGLDPLWDFPGAFVLEVSPWGEAGLRQDGRSVPIFGPYLEYVFSSAGIELRPGQVLLLDPGLAKQVIEEALGRIAREQAFLTWETSLQGPGQLAETLETKIELVAASLAADDLIERQKRGEDDPVEDAA